MHDGVAGRLPLNESSLEGISQRVSEIGRGPFLFIGSGFSRRYLNCPTWEALLIQHSIAGKDFGYYLTKANGDLPTAAGLLADEYLDKWWSLPDFEESRKKWNSKVRESSDPLKVEISNFLQMLGSGDPAIMPDEKAALSNIVVDGIITTNWDCFLESAFPDFKVFKGQDSLLFSNPVCIAEIYKIHGCCTEPTSLVLTNDDYKRFRERNAYLAAKLVSIFLEHPVFFFGYSLSDPHIVEILDSIVRCLGRDHASKLQDRLFFVNWDPSATIPILRRGVFKIADISLPITTVDSATFTPIYNELVLTQRKIPARILRYCKEQLYELIQQNDTKGRLCVLPIDSEQDFSKVDFVVGIGASRAHTGARGYSPITRAEIVQDVLFNIGNFDAQSLLSITIPTLLKSSRNVPVFMYLAKLGINSEEAYRTCGLHLNDAVFQSVSPKYDRYRQRVAGKSLDDLLREFDKKQTLFFCQYLQPDRIDCNRLVEFLIQNYPGAGCHIETYFGKAVCVYDRAKYGWKQS